jgi:hypothetical protein
MGFFLRYSLMAVCFVLEALVLAFFKADKRELDVDGVNAI